MQKTLTALLALACGLNLETSRAQTVEVPREETIVTGKRAQPGRPNRLSDAVLKGDRAAAKALIDKGVDIEELDTRRYIAGPNGRRPLNWAALRNDTAMIELLLDAGAEINATNRTTSFSALHHAVEADAIDALKLLIAKGADLELRNSDGQTPLEFAVANNRVAAFELLKAAECSARKCEDAAIAHAPNLDELLAKLDAEVPGWLKQINVPGAAVAVIQDGVVTATRGYGLANVEKQIPVTPTTCFNVASISKTIAAWGVMRLVEQGKLDLDAPVETYLTRWHLPDTKFDERGVTIRRLLSHTAGLSLHGYPGWGPNKVLPTLEQLLSGKSNGSGAVYLIMDPGTRWQYSGGGYTLAQLIVEEVTGKSFEDYMRETVLRPLGMTASDFHLSKELMARSSLAYDERGRLTPKLRFAAQAAGGLYTNVEDLATFAAAALPTDTGKLAGRGVLKPQTIELMLTPAPASNGTYGLGYATTLRSTGRRGRGHGGSHLGWQAVFEVVPETRDGIVVLTNSSIGGRVHQRVVQTWDRWLRGASEM
jgi:CubicO group peptidase (beta-lactamase class C family)